MFALFQYLEKKVFQVSWLGFYNIGIHVIFIFGVVMFCTKIYVYDILVSYSRGIAFPPGDSKDLKYKA